MKKLVLTALMMAGVANAAFEFIRIGDLDGFGIDGVNDADRAGAIVNNSINGPLKNFAGVNADTNGNGLIGVGEFLPDWDLGGQVAASGTDDTFDGRTAAEIGGAAYVGSTTSNITDVGMDGSQWTDISLDYTYNLSGHSPLGTFPDANPATSNIPVFTFDFTMPKTELTVGTPLYFNIDVGDYDTGAAAIQFTFVDGSSGSLPITQADIGTEDGLVQGAFTALDFSDVFEEDTGDSSLWHGNLTVTFNAGSEPYLAFDYVEIGTTAIIPEPASFALLGLSGLVFFRRRRR